MFHRGQLVLCIGVFKSSPVLKAIPRKGTVYTVRDVVDWPEHGPGLRLAEIVNGVFAFREADGGVQDAEPSFQSIAFRPLDESRLAVFRQMLAPTPVKEDA